MANLIVLCKFTNNRIQKCIQLAKSHLNPSVSQWSSAHIGSCSVFVHSCPITGYAACKLNLLDYHLICSSGIAISVLLLLWEIISSSSRGSLPHSCLFCISPQTEHFSFPSTFKPSALSFSCSPHPILPVPSLTCMILQYFLIDHVQMRQPSVI